jgi:hypothetical protein
MRESQKLAQKRYRFRQRPLILAAKLLALITNPPSQLRFTQTDNAALMARFDQTILLWRQQHDAPI